MKLVLSIMMVAAGIGMILPVAVPWVRNLSQGGRHYFLPDKHTDIIVIIGSTRIYPEKLLPYIAVLGAFLILGGIVGLWRAMKT